MCEIEPVILTPNMREMLDLGLMYLFGRDRSLRPTNILYPYKLESCKGGIEEARQVLHYVDKYTVEYMIKPGKVD